MSKDRMSIPTNDQFRRLCASLIQGFRRLQFRPLGPLLLAGLVAACGDNMAITNLTTMTDLITQTEEDRAIDRKLVDNLPYATIAAKIGDAPRAVLVLGRYEGQELHWFAANNVALALRNGRLVQTSGLSPDLAAAYSAYPDPIANSPQRLQSAVPFEWEIEIAGSPMRSILVQSTIYVEDTETITIADVSYDTLRLREEAQALGVNWKYRNYFWVDIDDGFVWQSRQHRVPGAEPIEIQILKPAARP